MTFTPSTYQKAIFDEIQKGEGHIIVNAVAGSGKTTTLVKAAELIEDQGLFLAFNKHIAEELNERLYSSSMVASTIHSIGNKMVRAALGKLNLEPSKYKKLARNYADNVLTSDPDYNPWDAARQLQKLVDLARVNLAENQADIDQVIAHHNLEIHPDVIGGVLPILAQGRNQAEGGVIDFTDMIWLPHVLKLTTSRVPWVFVDEAQDLSRAQLEIALKCASGRMVFVGDPRQAIYGFAGADASSFWNIKTRTNAKEMPLSVCYRCPRSHLHLARQVVPQIEAAPNAQPGEITYLDEDKLYTAVKPGDLVLCRVTAPLISACINLIQQKIPARVRGRDIGKDLVSLLEKVKKDTHEFTYENIIPAISQHRNVKVGNLRAADVPESQIESLEDRYDALTVCATDFGAESFEELKLEIQSIFSDEQVGVVFSTVHRAKGLENDRIFILKPDKLPLSWKNQQPWELEQEYNLLYVALTRGKQSLFVLGEPGSLVVATGDTLDDTQPAEPVQPELPASVTAGATHLSVTESVTRRVSQMGTPTPEARQCIMCKTDISHKRSDAVTCGPTCRKRLSRHDEEMKAKAADVVGFIRSLEKENVNPELAAELIASIRSALPQEAYTK